MHLLIIPFNYISNYSPLHSYPSTIPFHPHSPFLFVSMRELFHPLTNSCLSALASHYSGASSLHRTKGLPSNCCQMK